MKILEFFFMILSMFFLLVFGLIALVVYLVGAIVFTTLQCVFAVVRFVFSFWKKPTSNDYPKRSEMEPHNWTSNQTLEGLTLEQVNELTLRIVEIVEGMGGFVAGGFEQETSDEPRPDQNQ
jgi:membrane protein implicated in regulation of membrane protease activity